MTHRWTIQGRTWHDMTSGFLYFGISGFLDFAILQLLSPWTLIPDSALLILIQTQLLNNRIDFTLIVAFLLEKWCFLNPSPATAHYVSTSVKKFDCNLASMSLLMRSGSTVLAQTDSLCVIHFIAPLQARIRRALFWNLPQENWFIQLIWTLFTDSFHGFFPQKSFSV